MSETLVYLLVALVFLAAGGGAGFWFGQKRGREDAMKSTDLQKEFDAYRQQVSEHFAGTADHFQALGKQVRHLYDHMAEGADRLCSEQAAGKAIEFPAAGALTSAAADAAGSEPEATAKPESSREPEAEVDAAEGESEADTRQSSTAGDARTAERGKASEDVIDDTSEADDRAVKRVETADAGASFTVASEEDDSEKRSYH